MRRSPAEAARGFTGDVAKTDPKSSDPRLADPAGLTYEQARDQLVDVVARLEAGDETLEGSIALWERGEALAARCQEWLDGARARLDAARAPVAAAAEEDE